MKRFIAVAILCLSLSACMQINEAYTAKKEADLWRDANKRVLQECKAISRTDRAKAMEANACVANVVRTTVLPYATYPDLVANLIDAQAGVSRKFHDGKIDHKQADAEAQQLQAQYQASVTNRLYGR